MNRIVVHREGTKTLLEPTFNFHEGSPEFAINNDGSVSSVESGTEYTSNPSAPRGG